MILYHPQVAEDEFTQSFGGPVFRMDQVIFLKTRRGAWRIIPVSKWFINNHG